MHLVLKFIFEKYLTPIHVVFKVLETCYLSMWKTYPSLLSKKYYSGSFLIKGFFPTGAVLVAVCFVGVVGQLPRLILCGAGYLSL